MKNGMLTKTIKKNLQSTHRLYEMPWMSVTKDGMLETMIKYSFHCMVHSKIEKRKEKKSLSSSLL